MLLYLKKRTLLIFFKFFFLGGGGMWYIIDVPLIIKIIRHVGVLYKNNMVHVLNIVFV